MQHDMREEFGRFFEEFTTGDIYRHWPGKTVTESDNNLFCLLTMNHHPIHLDAHYSESQLHGRILVCGLLVVSVVVGMTVPTISGKAIANLEYERISHDGPVFVGDTLYARTEILGVEPSRSKPDRGVVHVETLASNQEDNQVLTLRRRVLVPRRRGS